MDPVCVSFLGGVGVLSCFAGLVLSASFIVFGSDKRIFWGWFAKILLAAKTFLLFLSVWLFRLYSDFQPASFAGGCVLGLAGFSLMLVVFASPAALGRVFVLKEGKFP